LSKDSIELPYTPPPGRTTDASQFSLEYFSEFVLRAFTRKRLQQFDAPPKATSTFDTLLEYAGANWFVDPVRRTKIAYWHIPYIVYTCLDQLLFGTDNLPPDLRAFRSAFLTHPNRDDADDSRIIRWGFQLSSQLVRLHCFGLHVPAVGTPRYLSIAARTEASASLYTTISNQFVIFAPLFRRLLKDQDVRAEWVKLLKMAREREIEDPAESLTPGTLTPAEWGRRFRHWHRALLLSYAIVRPNLWHIDARRTIPGWLIPESWTVDSDSRIRKALEHDEFLTTGDPPKFQHIRACAMCNESAVPLKQCTWPQTGKTTLLCGLQCQKGYYYREFGGDDTL
jgi:hypothetical protein